MEIKKIGIIGAGIMGSGIATNFASEHFEVVLTDISEIALEKARTGMGNFLRFQVMLKKTIGALSPEEVLKRIRFTTHYSDLQDVHYVVENVTENMEIKKEVYRTIDGICPGDVIFACNTSAIPITKIGSFTKRPDKVLGIHFMNPVPLKKSVEMIRGYHTSDQTIEISKNLCKQIGKESIVVNDSPGFVSNRVLMLTVNEAVFLVHENVASVHDIDQIFKSCFEHKMGPLETADLIGLDTILYSLEVLYQSFNDDKFRPCPLLKKMVDAGLLGRKSGKGFYPY
ncbi:MAG: 3-hydroxybutyryl-CoA dehydrogenase [Desulfobacteraceae bacterium]|nr:MAG: 3-hydroxybutyryl-CoA dehydrogenase [Desulfobacteraceae bacterium]